jgi:hypothetical protein
MKSALDYETETGHWSDVGSDDETAEGGVGSKGKGRVRRGYV